MVVLWFAAGFGLAVWFLLTLAEFRGSVRRGRSFWREGAVSFSESSLEAIGCWFKV